MVHQRNGRILILTQSGSSVHLTYYDPSDLGLICLEKTRKICFRIISDLRIQSYIFSKKHSLNWRHYMGKPAKYRLWDLRTFIFLILFPCFLFLLLRTTHEIPRPSSFEHDVVVRLFVWAWNHQESYHVWILYPGFYSENLRINIKSFQ